MTISLEGMTAARWASLSPIERAASRDNSGLTVQLVGLEGHRVEVLDVAGGDRRRFIVGKSAGWRPCHLEIKTTRSMGGGQARASYYAVRDLGDTQTCRR